jgi:TfoX/Sxy family transcriptional regulator of competence genes
VTWDYRAVAFDERLAERVRRILDDQPDVTERRMFGGLAFLVGGNLALAARGQGGLLVRVDPADHDAALAEPGTEPMVMRERLMRGWIAVAPGACAKPADLNRWVRRGLAYTLTLPAK